MSEDRILAQCSPTLAGLKTGSLFTYPYSDRCTLKDGIRNLNTRIVPRGIRLVPLKWMEKRVLLYMYRPEQLRADLAAAANGCAIGRIAAAPTAQCLSATA